jgi:hypothetical protein
MKYGWPKPERLEYLKTIKPMDGQAESETFQGIYQTFKVYLVPIDFPKYRIENLRTRSDQIEYIAIHPEIKEDFFVSDPEREDVQKIQHMFLEKMGKEAGLEEEFSKTTVRQTKSLILDSDGFVVNGNRRLAIMRNLYESEPANYSHFKHLRVIILPPCDYKDVRELESDLQLRRDFKADYVWTAKALGMREDMEKFHLSPDKVGEMNGQMSANEVENYIEMLEYAEAYLESRGKRKQYSFVKDDWYAFKRMVELKNKFKGDELKKLKFEQYAFNLIDSAEGQRLYTELKDLYEHFDSIVKKVEEEHQDILILDQKDPQQKDDDIGKKLGIPDIPISPIKNLDHLNNDQKENIRSTIRDELEYQKIHKKKVKKDNFVKDKVLDAHKCLTEAAQHCEPSMKKIGFQEQLDSIPNLVNQIKKWLDDSN